MKTKQILIASLGNTLEWLDFGLFLFMAPLMAKTFFPQHDPVMATLDTLMVFAAGFICRPLGGIFFGYFGDTQGRAKPLRFSVLLITLSTLCVGLIPSYSSIGYLAPILFTLLRLAQGFSIGGEYSGVMIYLSESAPYHRRGLISSFAASGANLGFLLATLLYLTLASCFTEASLTAWAWRLPFILVGLPGLILLYYRLKLSETSVYLHLKSKHHLEKQPFLAAIRDAPRALLKILGLTCMSASFYYVFFGYMPIYLSQMLHLSLRLTLQMHSGLLLAMLVLVPVAGLLGDYFSRRTMLIFTAISILLFSIPAFYLLQSQSTYAIIATLSLAALLSSLDQGNSLAAVVENCPEAVRYSGIAFSYNVGMALFGGTAPLIVNLLSTHMSLIAPSYYLILMAGFSLIAAMTLQRGPWMRGR